MASRENGKGRLDLPKEIHKRKRIILGELRERTLWFIRLRWWVPPAILIGAFLAHSFNLSFTFLPLPLIACFILGYNVLFFLLSRRIKTNPNQKEYIQRFTGWQIIFDYGTMFFLIHFTGGIGSPFIFFFIFHIAFSAIFLTPRWTYSFAGAAVSGMTLIALAEYFHWIPQYLITFKGTPLILTEGPFPILVTLGFFSGFVFITAYSITAVMRMLERRILDLAELTETVTDLNRKLRMLYDLVQAIGSKQHLDQVLEIATFELARVMEVQAISVKLLSEDGNSLHYASVYGLPPEFSKDRVVELTKSPLNRRVIDGEPFVSGRVTPHETFQFGEDLLGAGIRSVQFVPLVVEKKPIGILGAYSNRYEHFSPEDLDFFRLAAGLLAIAIENARSYEAIGHLIEERSRFMNRVAHNLRAPLVALSGMIEVLREGYIGSLGDSLQDYFHRMDRRVRGMIEMIGELMVLAKSQMKKPHEDYHSVDLKALINQVIETFQDEIHQKRLSFEIGIPSDLPEVRGDREMLEEMLENLLSNSIKYTPEGGRIGINFLIHPRGIRMVLSDNGRGIPRADQPYLFREFFRGSNVHDVIGTGLGLAIVKEIVSKHGGTIEVESEEGLGTTFFIDLPMISGEEVKRNGK